MKTGLPLLHVIKKVISFFLQRFSKPYIKASKFFFFLRKPLSPGEKYAKELYQSTMLSEIDVHIDRYLDQLIVQMWR